jgi:phosphoenolpyruvate carboxykinase (ATP)
MTIQVERAHGLEALGIVRSGRVHWNLGTAALYEESLRRAEGKLAAEGPLVCKTGQHTGRSPNDKFVVREPGSEQHVHWGTVNAICFCRKTIRPCARPIALNSR